MAQKPYEAKVTRIYKQNDERVKIARKKWNNYLLSAFAEYLKTQPHDPDDKPAA